MSRSAEPVVEDGRPVVPHVVSKPPFALLGRTFPESVDVDLPESDEEPDVGPVILEKAGAVSLVELHLNY